MQHPLQSTIATQYVCVCAFPQRLAAAATALLAPSSASHCPSAECTLT